MRYGKCIQRTTTGSPHPCLARQTQHGAKGHYWVNSNKIQIPSTLQTSVLALPDITAVLWVCERIHLCSGNTAAAFRSEGSRACNVPASGSDKTTYASQTRPYKAKGTNVDNR